MGKYAPEVQVMLDRYTEVAEKLQAGRVLYGLVDSHYSVEDDEYHKLKAFLDDLTSKNRSELNVLRENLQKAGVSFGSFTVSTVKSFSDCYTRLGIPVGS